jgi:hypothetical protein
MSAIVGSTIARDDTAAAGETGAIPTGIGPPPEHPPHRAIVATAPSATTR